MNTQGIPIGESMTWAWDRFRENVVLLVGAQIVVLVLPTFIETMGRAVLDNGFLEWIVSVVSTLVTLALQLGITNLALRIHDGKPVEFTHLFDTVPLALWFMLANILMFIVVGMGLLLFVIPGIIIAIRLFFIAFVMVDENANALDAFQRSWDVTRGYAFDVFLFVLLVFVINFFGLLLLGVGFLVTAPLTTLAAAYVFRTLKDRHDGIESPRASAPVAPPSQV